MKKILIDNGHGENTKGKRSPDGSLREYKWAREMADMVVARLTNMGYDAERIVPEESDVALTVRCRRVNRYCSELGKENVMCVSIHNDAAGDGSAWHDARGFSVRVSLNASKRSKLLAQCIYTEAEKAGSAVTGNRCTPKEKYWAQDLAICRDTNCAAVLVENLMQDNKQDVMYLTSAEGMETLCGVTVNGIINYIKTIEK